MSKKTPKTRPRFKCAHCGLLWVSLEPKCMICKTLGEPLNEGAEKLIKKAKQEN